ncbi:hypothetical protein D9M71_328490 [compost metagenome]
MEKGVAEYRAGAVEQRRGDRRSAIADGIERGQVEFARLRIAIAAVQQHLDHGRRQQRFGDTLVGDGLEHGLRHEVRQHHMGPTAGQQSGDADETGHVEHRHDLQDGRIDSVGTMFAHSHDAETGIVVADHHPFREAGGAAGIENTQQRIAATAHILYRLVPGDKGFVAMHAFRSLAVAGVDQDGSDLRLAGDSPGHALEGIVDDQHGGFGIVEGIDDFRHAPAGVDRVEHGIGPGHGEEVFDIALRVEGQHGDAIAAVHAQALQAGGQAGDAIAELGEGEATPLVTNGRLVRALLDMTVQGLREIHWNLQ